MITIRTAIADDLPAILDIYNEAIANTTAVYDYKPHTLEMRQAWYEAKRAQGFPVFVAVRDGLIAGFSALGPFRAWEAYRYTAENSVYVAADQRGQGIGKLLLAPLIDEAQRMGMHAIVAGIDADNVVSVRLHRRFGFKEAAHFKQVGYKFGRWLDLLFMELVLTDQVQSGLDTVTQVVTRFNDALNAHDVDAMMQYLSEDTVFENTDPPPDGARFEGKTAVRAFWEEFMRSSQGQTIEVEEIFSSGNRCTMRWNYHWTGADGRQGHIRGVDVYTIRDGLISEKLSYVKG